MGLERKPYTYIPDEAVDFGVLGEHFPVFTAFVDFDYEFGKEHYSVNITEVKVTVPKVGTLDVKHVFTDRDYIRKNWEDEIYRAYRKYLAKDWAEVGT